ncbi:MAG: Response regulator receiver protein [candidate division WWE3 bacterium GW2011_GWC1_41_7]|uniref:Response regulator receiver protein n=4 Tax=Katanobacteria TaxID=422282 RepID=A0A0G0X4B9_UNCKA|nr:MAG: Response regulator receiver protein [candidate division WWE3 bacterium GW2011_GWB1_41_6]KKS19825.1 MAG: Response regulator receiver protein [candidate division WWE3 bacterium GW2011_GWC1_41_7]KKS22715.1 MAG: Response regulator receiver protein [candidate division WWE3 bacterium GW2011_GWA1_41_8]OGC57726.1 MAG: hypothetical protein A2976_02190 [candidate division WWE3 bacterium RIFCSPLOWO2_01_FULL_41_9]
MNHITKQRTILAIEDEKPLLDAIRIRLENMGFRALTARSIEEAIGKLQSGERVDAIWLDHYLIGQENGLDLVVKIKSTEDWKNIPVFVVSNTATNEKVQAYLQLGIQKYYVKSNFRMEEIIKDIAGYLENPEVSA